MEWIKILNMEWIKILNMEWIKILNMEWIKILGLEWIKILTIERDIYTKIGINITRLSAQDVKGSAISVESR